MFISLLLKLGIEKRLTDAPCKIGGFGSQGVIAAKEEVALEVDARNLRHTPVGQEEYIRAELHRLCKSDSI